MSAADHWVTIEKHRPRAVRISADFIKALVDEPNKRLIPAFSEETGEPLGVYAKISPADTLVTIGNWIVQDGDSVEILDYFEFQGAYALAD